MRPGWTGERLHGQTSCPQQSERHHWLQTEGGESALCATTSICSGDWFFGFCVTVQDTLGCRSGESDSLSV